MEKLFHIYGDNIVECTRTLDYIKNGFPSKSILEIKMDFKNITTPRFLLITTFGKFYFLFFPGTNASRWNKDIYQEFVIKAGGVIKEGADALITEVTSDSEKPLLALEFSAALPAGNNAWQRSGRAYSLAQAGIPYFYLVHLAGKEYKKETNSLATRLPNPALSLSFALNTIRTGVPSLLVYSDAPEADKFYRDRFTSSYGVEDFSKMLFKMLTEQEYDSELTRLYNKNIEFLKQRATLIENHAYTPEDYDSILKSKNPYKKLKELTNEKQLKWNKKIAGKIRNNFVSQEHRVLELIKDIEDHSYAIITKDLPCTFVPAANRKKLADHICNNLYKDRVTTEFKNWIYQEDDLVICLINGFKPRGDDSRPDRGLAPFSKMLLDTDVLTIVFGTAKSEVWNTLDNKPSSLFSNGLWQSIFNFSEGILVDTPTRLGFSINTYYKGHWSKTASPPYSISKKNVSIKDYPKKIGENDVDTAIHILFKYVANKFECVCNPPGGDWSGISLLSGQTEYRWTSMNRVSEEGTKRPDHIYQLEYEGKPTLFLVESKGEKRDLFNDKEINVGLGMIEYLKNLMDREYTALRPINENWTSASGYISLDNFNTFTGVAYLLKGSVEDNYNDSQNLLTFSNAHLALALELNDKNSIMHIFTINNSAYNFARELRSMLNSTHLNVKIYRPSSQN
jgi:hypothetical protein